MTNFIGRKKELIELNNRYNSAKKEFGVIYGRRRIGKSFLIEKFLEGKNAVFFQAKSDSLYGNLSSFSLEVNKYVGISKNYVYGSWAEAFDEIINKTGNNRIVIAIDEYPYIVSQCPSFPSILQDFIDKSKDNVFVLISGSDVSMLKKEILDHNSPLYKRRTFEMEIKKLDYKEALLFLEPFKNEEKEKYLSVFSTFPYYLAAINKNLSFDENIKNLLFNQYGTFFTLPDQLLSNSTKIQDIYNSILEAIANRKKSNKDIALYIHEPEAKTNKYLATLLEAEIVEKREMFDCGLKSNYYEIFDQLLKFWFTFIFKNLEKIKINGEKIYEQEQASINVFLNHGFEHIAGLYIDQLNKDGKLIDVFERPKIYKVEKSKLGRSIEIDGISRSNNNLLIIDCKDSNKVYTKEMFEHLSESVSIFPNKLNKIYYIFSKAGYNEDIKNLKNENINLINYKDLFTL